MPARKVHVPASDPDLQAGLARIRTEFDVPADFPAPVDAAATAAATAPRDLGPRVDLRDVEFVTIDPPGSRDLDQAFHAERRAGGTRVHYAIADVAAFVVAGDPVDVEGHARGVTLYLPDGRAPLYPKVLGEGAASLLPGGERPAVCWTIDLDAHGEATAWRLERATVRSREQLTYEGVQHTIDAGNASEPLQLLREIGRLRQERERARGGVSLPLPSQSVVPTDGGYELAYDVPFAVEAWNAQISLLAGIFAADTMLDGGVGILRTLPPAEPQALARLQRAAHALGIDWPKGRSYPDVVHALDPAKPAAAAFLQQAVETLRGAGYSLVDPKATTPPVHGALATPYAHVTAPLRRLADRIANEVVVALCAQRTPAPEVVEALTPLPDLMDAANHRDAHIERAVVDLAEALVLRGHDGETFRATVVDADKDRALLLLRQPAVIANLPHARVELGAEVDVRLIAVDPTQRRVEFALA